MCVVSYVGDYYRDSLPQRYPWVIPITTTGGTVSPPLDMLSPPTRAEFDALKRDIEELKLLLKAAKRFDEATGQPDCETESKVALIKKLADLVGVDMAEVFGK